MICYLCKHCTEVDVPDDEQGSDLYCTYLEVLVDNILFLDTGKHSCAAYVPEED